MCGCGRGHDLIDEILEALSDGEWHLSSRIIEGKQVNFDKLRVTMGFLVQFEMVEKNTSTAEYRLVPSVAQFLRRIRKIELAEPL
jgi:predicted transcriptional regulator